ncbi:ribonuclease H-like domain-containing protein [Tanacetum coccineum]|uniref:Ribonuclease H-like domain-containing protein n=1 Tax=Tanacetum coccineum TaxID=301880 RepID=A0ABQ5A3Y7_9ASTR
MKKVNNGYVVENVLMGCGGAFAQNVGNKKYNKYKESKLCNGILVAKGYNQREGLDYEETFSPVVKINIVRCLIAIFVYNNWPLYQLDVNSTFFYVDLYEEVYMELPPSFYDKNESKVCNLVKSLYGLNKLQCRGMEITTALVKNGFVQSKNDYALYIKSKNGLFIALIVYVDDIVITRSNVEEI